MSNNPLTNRMGLPNEPGYSNNIPADSSIPLDGSREGGDDSLAVANPSDPRNDEKVIANPSRSEQVEGPGDTGGRHSAPDRDDTGSR